MAEKVIDKNKAWVPFLSDKMSFITGLDPLGLQNPSTQAYSYLQPGLNNVTSHIRSYSFYCWLLEEYAKQINSTDPFKQKQFIRKAEYILALASVVGEKSGISGSTYASKHIEESPFEYDLEEGTYNSDGSTDKTYWQFHYGVFGQYYIGSLRQIGIIEEPINEQGEALGFYRRTAHQEGFAVSGQALAEAFDENITNTNKKIFLSAIDKGKISKDNLLKLVDEFDLNQIQKGSTEQTLLKELLLQIDEPMLLKEESTSMRMETLKHVLRFAQNKGEILTDRAFTMFAYDVKGKDEKKIDTCLTGWYFYQFNEYWQFSCTAILNGLLDFLKEERGPKWMDLHDLIHQSSQKVVEALLQEWSFEIELNTVEDLLEYDLGTERELHESILNVKSTDRMMFGFVLLWTIYTNNKEYLKQLEQYTKQRKIGIPQNHVLVFFLDFEKHSQQSLLDFIQWFLLKMIVYKHQSVAYRKMGNGSQSTQKFIIEDNYIRRLGNFNPFFTGPRVGKLIGFLKDLNLLDENYKITSSGAKIIL